MGMYIDPDNESFRIATRSEIYVDKTGLLSLLNNKIDTEQNHVCISHARRFGKSVAAGMMDAYYSVGCDSRELLAPYEISRKEDFEMHLNQYHVLHFDMASFLGLKKEDMLQSVSLLKEVLMDDIREEYPEMIFREGMPFNMVLGKIYTKTKRKFIIIIDEWDCLLRESGNEEVIHEYLQFLRGLFKSEESKKFLALGYITGILPIKKIKNESAMNNFFEYTMVRPGRVASYFGFTEAEVERLCDVYKMDLEEVKKWYDGYHMGGHHMYNPNSLVSAFLEREIANYWKNTSSFETINDYIQLGYGGLKEDVLKLLAGELVPVNVNTFQNDLSIIRNKDEALTALLHLGYLGYEESEKSAFIPNEEVRAAFESALLVGEWNDVREALEHSDKLLQKTLEMDEEAVAAEITKPQMDYASIIEYNDENSLSCAVMMAYYTARREYTIIRELPTGKGFADLVFLPKPECRKSALLVELKWDRLADTALKQIKEKRYAGKLEAYMENLLLVGINYEKQTKEASCVIEKWPE